MSRYHRPAGARCAGLWRLTLLAGALALPFSCASPPPGGPEPPTTLADHQEKARRSLSASVARRVVELLDRGDLAGARVELAQGRLLGIEEDVAHLLAARIEFEQGEMEMAGHELDAVFALGDPAPDAWYLRGLVRMAQGAWTAAAGDLERFLALAPGSAEARIALSRCRLALGDAEAAVSLFEDLDGPVEVDLLAAHGQALLAAGRDAKAAVLLGQARDARPADPGIVHALALAEYRLGHPGACWRLLAAEKASDLPVFLVLLRGRAALASGRLDDAAADLRECLARDPEWGRVWSDLSCALALAGDLPGARRAAERACGLLPGDAACREFAAALADRDDDAAAATSYRAGADAEGGT